MVLRRGAPTCYTEAVCLLFKIKWLFDLPTQALFTIVEFDRTSIGLRLKFDRIRWQFDGTGAGQGGFLHFCLVMSRKALPTWLRAPFFWLKPAAEAIGCTPYFREVNPRTGTMVPVRGFTCPSSRVYLSTIRNASNGFGGGF